jgi:hypothetical protein
VVLPIPISPATSRSAAGSTASKPGAGRHDLFLGHRGAFGEIGCRAVKVQRMDIQLCAESLGQLVDRRPAMGEVPTICTVTSAGKADTPRAATP